MHRAAYQKAVQGQGGRALAVKLKCLDCCCWQRIDVAACTATGCPLWHVRPYQAKAARMPASIQTPPETMEVST
jgi:hypothetical protein